MELGEITQLLELLEKILKYLVLISSKIKEFLLANNLPLPILLIGIGFMLLLFREISKWVAWFLIGLGVILLLASLNL
jgi:hypothetical protein